MTKDEILKALRQAYNLGQIYWQQADSEYMSQHKKADQTEAKFQELLETTVAALEAKDEPVANYGYCPVCGAKGTSRERHPDGNTTCVNGHKYKSRDTLSAPPQQEAKDEPVAWWIPKHKAPDMVSKVRWSDECEPLYTTPPQRKPLSKAEAAITAYRGYDEYWTKDCNGSETEAWIACARAIEAAHGIKEEV